MNIYNRISLLVGTNNEELAILLCQNLREFFFHEFTCDEVCSKLKKNSLPGVVRVFSESNYKVADFEKIETEIALSVAENFGIFIIENLEKASAAVVNKLLKKIEEPSSNHHFIFTTTNEIEILPTILSRCNYKKYQSKALLEKLEESPLIDFFLKNFSLKDIERLEEIIDKSELDYLSSKKYLETICNQICNNNYDVEKVKIILDAIPDLQTTNISFFWKMLFIKIANLK